MYKGGYITTDTDQDCWVQCVEARLHGRIVYESEWFDITAKNDSYIAKAEDAIDRAWAEMSEPYTTITDFGHITSIPLRDGEAKWVYRLEDCRLGFFYLPDSYIYAAAYQTDGDGFIYGEISEADYKQLLEFYHKYNFIKACKEIDAVVKILAKEHYLMGGKFPGYKTMITKKDCLTFAGDKAITREKALLSDTPSPIVEELSKRLKKMEENYYD